MRRQGQELEPDDDHHDDAGDKRRRGHERAADDALVGGEPPRVGKRDLYPLLAGSLARYVSKPVRATSATVVQLAGIDSFWAGRSQNQKVLVKIDLGGRRPPKLHEGQQVSFVGRLVKAPKQGGSLGVKGSTGQPVLTSQGAYIVVPFNKLQLQ